MSAILRDLQEERDVRVTSKTLASVLRSFRGRAPFIAELVGDSPNKLTVGIGPSYGFVQHAPASGAPPYFVARTPGAIDEGIKTYVITSTETEIAGTFTLPMADLIAILTFFIETGQRSPDYEWEEI